MFERPLRALAVLVTAVVLVSFGLFAIDETRDASARSRDAIAAMHAIGTAAPSPAGERARERRSTAVREVIDDANDIVVAPFAGVVDSSSSTWVRRGVPALIALLVFGAGLAFLARFAKGRTG